MISSEPSGFRVESSSREDADGPPILIVPGLYNSEPDHWQSHWERAIPGAERVDQTDWERPLLGDWTISLAEAVRQRPGAILVAHSLGCALVAHLTQVTGGRGIGGALMVAPADVNREGPAGRLLTGFSPIPRLRLPYPSLVVASRDDPYVEIERAEAFARGGGRSSWTWAARATSTWRRAMASGSRVAPCWPT
jgi:predicted alpha/beta hydrolase family esterase